MMAVTAACAGADLLWLESPTNPLLQVADLPACIAAARQVNPAIEVLLVSATTGQGLDAWLDWLLDEDVDSAVVEFTAHSRDRSDQNSAEANRRRASRTSTLGG